MAPREALGRGLGALIPTGASALTELPVTSIVPSRSQPRQSFDEEGISSLAASIRQVGILQPLVVRPSPDGRYELVVGERRWRAARRAGLSAVPALVVETDDRGVLQRALVENVHRQDLGPLEEAAAYSQMIDEGGLTHEQLAEHVGLSRPSVSNALRLLDLPPPVQALLRGGQITAGHARALLGLAEKPELLERLAERVAQEGMSVRQTEELVKEDRESPGRESVDLPERSPRDAGLLELANALSDELQTRVNVSMGRRKGKIVIEFGSLEDLDRIFRLIAHMDKPPVAIPGGEDQS
jgi:ParB family chromosome partitioning protein